MWFAHCPLCNEAIRTPSNLPPTSQVQCPLCGETFAGAVLLDSLPPEVVVIESGTAESTGQVDTASLQVQPESDPDSFTVDALGDPLPSQPNTSEPFQFEEAAAPVGKHYRPTVYTSSSPHSGKNEFFKIVAGGIAGLVLAVLILWWGFERDPFTLAPKVAKYAPWLIPPELQPIPSEATASPWQSSDSPDMPRAALKGFSDSIPTAPSNIPFDRADDGAQPPIEAPRFGAGRNAGQFGGGGFGGSLPNDNPTPDFDPPKRVPVRQAPSFTVDDVLTAFSTVEEMWAALQELEILESPQTGTPDPEFYGALCRLAECVTYIDNDPRTVQIRNQIAAALKVYTNQRAFRLLIDQATRQRLSSRDTATGDGLCLRGHVQDIHPHGNLFVTRIALPGRPSRFLSVLSAVDPREFYAVGSDVMLLGSIIERPSRRIQGYRGRLNRVVIGGLVTQVPTEHPPEPLDTP
ncbi:MAG: hypothetical protein VX346_26890 [Planctomycetota bacterium]|nr:hypothetical protein [Planctomycetota bacterium]